MPHVDRHPKSGVYRIRRAFPAHLRELLGAASITKSLGTKDGKEAKKLALPLLAAIQAQIDAAEAALIEDRPSASVPSPKHVSLPKRESWELEELSIRQINSLIFRWRSILQDEWPYDAIRNNLHREGPRAYRNEYMKGRVKHLVQQLDHAGSVSSQTLEALLKELLPMWRFRYPEDTDTLQRLSEGFYSILNALHGMRVGVTPTKPFQAPAKPSTQLVNQVKPASHAVRLHDLVQTYINLKQPSEQTVQAQWHSINQMEQILGIKNPWVHEVTFAQAEKVRETLQWQPKSLPQKYKGKSLVDIASMMRSGDISLPRSAPGTFAKKLRLISAIFEYAAQRGHLGTGNPFTRLIGPKDADPVLRVMPFDAADIKKIFSHPVFQGCVSEKDHWEPGDVLIKSNLFWLPLLALTTGARLEELGQLLLQDVREEEGILYLDITQKSGKSEKSIKKIVEEQKQRKESSASQHCLKCGI